MEEGTRTLSCVAQSRGKWMALRRRYPLAYACHKRTGVSGCLYVTPEVVNTGTYAET